jgi:hypothetical protein
MCSVRHFFPGLMLGMQLFTPSSALSRFALIAMHKLEVRPEPVVTNAIYERLPLHNMGASYGYMVTATWRGTHTHPAHGTMAGNASNLPMTSLNMPLSPVG